ncbi:MAG: MerR family transcriptional regulator [Nitrososphaerales archaeon]|nr:MerR family transcriptional regulator [Nitrososphaerales archaeon]
MSRDGGRHKRFSIHEVSRMTGVPAHTLRFWEKDFGAYLRPPRTAGGQRRYSPSDVDVVEQIKHFRYEQQYTVARTIGELGRRPVDAAEIERIVDQMTSLIRRKVMEKISRRPKAKRREAGVSGGI